MNTLSISKIPSNYKIILPCGDIFYAHNVKNSYSFYERKKEIENFKNYFYSLNKPNKIQIAYQTILWHLFADYLNGFSFSRKVSKNKDLYILRNSKGFIKVGVSKNINTRLVDLKYEFDGDWEVIKIHINKGHLEQSLIYKLAEYYKPIVKQNGKLSRECFEDCDEVLSNCIDLNGVNKIYRSLQYEN